MLQAAEAVGDAKPIIADVLQRRATAHVALSNGETTTFEACLGMPYEDGLREVVRKDPVRPGWIEPVWTDAAPPFRFCSGASTPILAGVAAAAGHGEVWRPERAMGYCSRCQRLADVVPVGDWTQVMRLAHRITVYGARSSLSILVAPSRCTACLELVPFAGHQQFLYRYDSDASDRHPVLPFTRITLAWLCVQRALLADCLLQVLSHLVCSRTYARPIAETGA